MEVAAGDCPGGRRIETRIPRVFTYTPTADLTDRNYFTGGRPELQPAGGILGRMSAKGVTFSCSGFAREGHQVFLTITVLFAMELDYRIRV